MNKNEILMEWLKGIPVKFKDKTYIFPHGKPQIEKMMKNAQKSDSNK